MVVGIDVAHPSPGSIENAPSVVGMVASFDDVYVQWPGGVRTQQSRQEIQKIRRQKLEKEKEDLPQGQEEMVSASNMSYLMSDRLRLYFQSNQSTLPDNILIYRDGKT